MIYLSRVLPKNPHDTCNPRNTDRYEAKLGTSDEMKYGKLQNSRLTTDV